MSNSRIFHTLIGDKSVLLVKQESQSDHLLFHGTLRNSLKRCPACGCRNVWIKDTKLRTFRALNLGDLKTYVRVPVPKVSCRSCGKSAWISPPFALGKLPMTRSFINYIIQLMGMTTLVCVAYFLGLQWRTVKNIDKTNLQRRSKLFSFRKLRYVSIDEIAIRKGHNYMTIFTDISTGQIIHAVEGRSEKEIRQFLKLLQKKAKRLAGIAIDMSASDSSAVKEHLPHVKIVYDRFHVTKLLNDMVDEVRREQQQKSRQQGQEVVKGGLFLLLRNFETLDKEKKNKLEQLLQINRPLAIAHTMKEQFRLFWGQGTVAKGAGFLVGWCWEAFDSGVELLVSMIEIYLFRLEQPFSLKA